VVSSHSILFTFVITRVEFGTARHVIPPSVEVEREVVEAASSEVMGRVLVVVLRVVMVVVAVIVKLGVMMTEPSLSVVDITLIDEVPLLIEPPPPPLPSERAL
jgi:hypothetical protein